MGSKKSKTKPHRKNSAKAKKPEKANIASANKKGQVDQNRDDAVEFLTSTWIKNEPLMPTSNERIKECYDDLRKIIQAYLSSKKYQPLMIEKALLEIVMAAYIDRGIVYAMTPTESSLGDSTIIERIQRLRHKADIHLINVIRAYQDVNRPKVNVVVKQTEQVNIADKQINVSKGNESSSDLDKK